MFALHVRMYLLLGILFAIIYAVVVVAGTAMGIENSYFYIAVSLGMMFVQYMIGPKVVEWSMHIRYIKREENPRLFQMVEQMAKIAHIPMPRIGIANILVPNAFAFGRGQRDGRVCVTQGILNLLNEEELRAVIGHELAHIRNRDILTITLLSVIPSVFYHIAWQFMFHGRRRNDGGSNTILIGMVAFLFYFITNLLVLYGSRIREYFADRGSVEFGNKPAALASALYKLVYGSARVDREVLKEAEGLKAFFINDLSQSRKEISELRQLDLDKSGTLDTQELAALQRASIQLTFTDSAMELLGTHPNMLKRIKHLSSINHNE